ncbi:MAG: AAA family ATPase [Gammaproteobacteria bacterium]|nr:AAA family ATPase [Gammaproteobacteria bacterium]
MATQDTQTTSSDELALSSRSMTTLGLQQQPFSSAILSDKTTYTDSILNKQYETIKHHLQFSDLILIVEGILGSGKTTLFRRLFQLDIASLYLMPIQAEATDTLVQIQQKMTIHMQNQGNANYLDDNLKNLQVFDQTPVLIIDDAHVLSDTTLQELLRYKQQLSAEKDTQLKLLLLANKGMAKTLEQISDLEHNQFYVQEMPKFSAKQILAFIAHRLKLAGAQSLPQLDEASVQKLAQKTDGIPAAVMSAAARLINSQRSTKSKLPLKPPSRPVLLGSGLVILLAVAGWYLYPVFSPKMADVSPTLPLADNPVVAPIKPLFVEPASEHTSADNEAENHNSLQGRDADVELADPIEPPDDTTTSNALLEPMPGPSMPAISQPVVTETPVEPPTTDDAKSDINADAELLHQNPIVEPAPLPTTRPEPLVQAKPDNQPVAPTPITKPALKVAAVNAPPVKPNPTPVTARTSRNIDPALRSLGNMGIKDQNWLLQQNKNQWTLQVLGAQDPQTLVKFAKTHRLGPDTAWYQTSRNGAPWYVLVHRFYTDRDIARNSISRLPASLRQARPWVRSMDSIHKAVN